MPEPLTPLEQRVYHYMIDFLAEHTYQPSIREIAKTFRIKSTKTVSDLLHALSNKGYIERDQSRSRGVRILGLAAARLTQPVPVYADVGPRGPLSPDQRTGWVTVDRRYLPAEDAYYVRAADDARELGVLAGDHVLVAPSSTPTRSGAVAVRTDDGVVVRAADGSQGAVLGAVAGVYRPLAEQTQVPMLPMGDAAASLPVS